MKSKLVIILILILAFRAGAQVTKQYIVPVTVQIQELPPQITLSWTYDIGVQQYAVYRKGLSDTSWNTLAVGLPNTVLSITDANVVTGVGYEYKVQSNRWYPTNGIGYVYSGIKVPATEYRGKIILMVDNYFSTPLASEIQMLEKDLIGDGWVVIRHDVSRIDSVTAIKQLIINDYNFDTANVKALFLLGHVPVPYSGGYTADGHTDHVGAWPADVYYASIGGTWTDVTVNDTTAIQTRNHNVPGDGKFDQSKIPADSKLMTGRVDFANMPMVPLSETQLMRNYLNRLHAYKIKQFDPVKRCMIDDNFGDHSGWAFAQNGWRIGSVVTPDSVSEKDYFTTLRESSYQWAYACGPGGWSICQGVGYITDFAVDTIQTVFNLLLGSYFGDWDCNNNFLRSPLTAGALATAWVGIPHWQFHSMSLGEPIGFCARLAQNDSITYYGFGGMRYVHIALMGDPSLRQHIVAPPSNLTGANTETNQVELHWSPSHDTVLGYHIFKLDTVTGIYQRISPAIVNDTNFTDLNITTVMSYYMVRAIWLENSVTGTYYNMSEGIFDTVQVILSSVKEIPQKKNIVIYPNPFTDKIHLTNSNGSEYCILFNSFGETIWKGENIEQQDFTYLTRGIYLLTSIYNNRMKTLKLVKQ